jgi:hypothetical protein
MDEDAAGFDAVLGMGWGSAGGRGQRSMMLRPVRGREVQITAPRGGDFEHGGRVCRNSRHDVQI